jgi:microcompartment protein CcmK/EutM
MVVGNVVSTVKTHSHKNCKLMVVQQIDTAGKKCGDSFIAVDGAQAGIGDYVLIVEEGGSVREVLKKPEGAIDAVIVGVVDSWETDVKRA